jgi:hypothetical protein
MMMMMMMMMEEAVKRLSTEKRDSRASIYIIEIPEGIKVEEED